jgi:hypothetical protein
VSVLVSCAQNRIDTIFAAVSMVGVGCQSLPIEPLVLVQVTGLVVLDGQRKGFGNRGHGKRSC